MGARVMLRQAVTYPAQLMGPWRCTARRRLHWFVLLLGGTIRVLSCVTLPEQPGGAQPCTRLVLPEASASWHSIPRPSTHVRRSGQSRSLLAPVAWALYTRGVAHSMLA